MLFEYYRFGAHVAARTMKKALVKLHRPGRGRVNGECLGPMEIYRLAAERLGIELHDLGCGAFELRHAGQARLFCEWTPDLENAFTYWVTGHKHMTFELLRRAGITEIPRYRVFTLSTAGEARRDLRERPRRVVVKPCFGTAGGDGVTVRVETERELNRAIYEALCHDRELMVEDFVEGDNYRVLLSDGRLLSVVKRIPASVVGDGIATVRELVERENARRSRLRGARSMYALKLDDRARRHLQAQGKSLGTVPGAGERVFLAAISNFSAGADAEEVTDLVCGETVELCRRVADVLRIRLAGLDLITKDITRPLRETGGVINEVNTSPVLLCHYGVRNQDKARDVAREVLLDMFPSARPAAAAGAQAAGAGSVAERPRRSRGSEPGLPALLRDP